MKYYRSMLLALVATPLFATTYNVSTTQELTDAIGSAADGDEIVLAAGTFEITSTINLDKGITLRGVGARENSIIKVITAKICGVNITHANAALDGLTITGATNEADGRGAVVMSAGLVTNCVFSGNTHSWPSRGPAALYMTGGRASGCLFSANTMKSTNYGVVRLNGSGAVFDHCCIKSTGMASNYNYKGPLYLQAGTVDTCILYSNDVGGGSDSTGGIYVTGDDVVVRNCTIVKNGGTKRGSGPGGIYWNTAKTGARIVNNIVYGNQTQSGSPDFNVNPADYPQVFLNNLTADPLFTNYSGNDFSLTANSPARNAGTDTCGLGTSDYLGNKRVMGGQVDIGAYEYVEASINCNFSADAVVGNLQKVFHFTSTVGGQASGNQTYSWTFHNETDPNCVDVTSNVSNPDFTATAVGSWTVSLTVTDGTEIAERTYENYLTVSNFSCSFSADKTSGLSTETFVFTSAVTGSSGGSLGYTWSFTNETTGAVQTSTAANPNYIPDAPGYITVALTVTDGGNAASSCTANYLMVQTGICYVDPDNAAAAFPYSSWNTAASNIVDAVAAVGAGGEVILASKTISISDKITLDKGVTVRGTGAREDTVIRQTVQSKSVFAIAHADAVVKNLTVTGAVMGYLDPSAVVISEGGMMTNCVIRGNRYRNNSTTYAPPMAATVKNGRLTGSLICGNIGGHAYASTIKLDGANALVDHCVISNNSNAANCSCNGTIEVNSGRLDNCLVVRNTATVGNCAGVMISGDNHAVISSCTIADNTSTGATCGGLYHNHKSDSVRVVNSIFYGNQGATAADCFLSATGAQAPTNTVFKNNLFGTCPFDGDTCTIGNPNFVDAANADYRLTSASTLARDAGIASWSSTWNKTVYNDEIAGVDLDENERVMGTAVDLGCYEYDPNQASVVFTVDKSEGFEGASFSFTSEVIGVDNPSFAWELSTNNIVVATSSAANPTFTIDDDGIYSAKVTVNGTLEYSQANCMKVAKREYFVQQGVLSLADALDATIDGGILTVDGQINGVANIVVAKAVTIRGKTGAATDILRGDGSHEVIAINNAQTVLRGVTVTNGKAPGRTNQAGGVRIMGNGGTVEDCLVVGNKGGLEESGIGIHIADGAVNAIVRRTIVRGNQAMSTTGAGGIYIGNGRVESCLIIGNCTNDNESVGAAVVLKTNGTKLRNCTIVNNRAMSAIRFITTALANGSPEVSNNAVYGNYWETATVSRRDSTWGVGTDSTVGNTDATTYNTNNLVAAFAKCAFDIDPALPTVGNDGEELKPDTVVVPDPKFRNDGTYRLFKDSPLREAGVWQEWMTGETDLYGEPRAYESNRKRHNATIGCTSYPPKTGTLMMVK